MRVLSDCSTHHKKEIIEQSKERSERNWAMPWVSKYLMFKIWENRSNMSSIEFVQLTLFDDLLFYWYLMNLLSMIRLKVAIFGPWWRDQELDPHVCRAGLRVLNLFQSFYSGDINPLIVAARPSNRWAAPPGPPTCPAPVHCGIKTILDETIYELV